MRLSEIIKKEMCWSNLRATSKTDVIRELAGLISENDAALDRQLVENVLLEREQLGSTGIQDGIAIPHGKLPGLSKILIACGRSSVGIDFDAHDHKPTHLFFVLLAPEFAAGQHLKALARLSRLLKDTEFRQSLMSSKDSTALYDAILDEDGKV